MLLTLALSIAKDGYVDLQTAYGLLMRKRHVLNPHKANQLIIRFEKIKDGEAATLDEEDAITLVTCCDITRKIISTRLWDDVCARHLSGSAGTKKKFRIRHDLTRVCNEIFRELSEQALFSDAVEKQKEILKDLLPQ